MAAGSLCVCQLRHGVRAEQRNFAMPGTSTTQSIQVRGMLLLALVHPQHEQACSSRRGTYSCQRYLLHIASAKPFTHGPKTCRVKRL